MPRYFIKTYGCQMNVADSAKLAEVLEEHGYSPASSEAAADFLLVNTCVVRQHAEDKAAWYLTSAKGLKKEKPAMKIALCGCLVTEPGRDVEKQFPHVDLFIPPHSPEKLAEYLSRVASCESLVTKRPGTREPGLVTIMTGCDNYCSYCIVPYVRGREYSRPLAEVLSEIKELIERGVTDITLLGQNVNSYKYGLAGLLRAIGELTPRPPLLKREGEKSLLDHKATPLPLGEGKGVRVQFLTSHPRDLSDEIITAVAELPYVVKDFALPLQSGDNEILRRMNRGYTYEYYLDRVKKIRSLIPTARISTDLMVGFPGESEAQFLNTMKALAEVKFCDVHMFAYSTRPTTAAAKLPDQLSEEVKQERLKRLIERNRQLLRG